MRRVVVTGHGHRVLPRNALDTVMRALRDGRSGSSALADFASLGLRSQVAGVPDIDIDAAIDRKFSRFMGGAAAYAYVAMRAAITDAGLALGHIRHPRRGLIAASGGASARWQVEVADRLREKGIRKVGPCMVPRTMGSTVSAALVTAFGILGLSYSISSTCATSAHCIGAAADAIRGGTQDVVFAGGGGMLVREDYEHAQRRGARIRAELVGYGATSNGADMVAPDVGGAARSMRMATHGIGRPIDYLNAHGTATPLGDIAELAAVREAFGADAPPVSSTKALTRHSLGAAGVHGAIYSLLMLDEGFIAGSANIEQLDPQAEGFRVVRESRPARLATVISNSFFRRHQRNAGVCARLIAACKEHPCALDADERDRRGMRAMSFRTTASYERRNGRFVSVMWPVRGGRRLPSSAYTTRLDAGVQACCCRRTRVHTFKPGAEVAQRAIERLADRSAEVEPGVQPDVRDGEALAGDEHVPVQHRVEPGDTVLRDRLEAFRRRGCDGDPIPEACEPFRVVIGVVDVFGDVQLGAALPLTRRRALFGRAADQRRLGVTLFEVFHDRDGFGDAGAIVELQHGSLAGRVAGEIGKLPVFAGEYVDLLHRQGDLLFSEVHPHGAWSRREGIEQQHGGSISYSRETASIRLVSRLVRAGGVAFRHVGAGAALVRDDDLCGWAHSCGDRSRLPRRVHWPVSADRPMQQAWRDPGNAGKSWSRGPRLGCVRRSFRRPGMVAPRGRTGGRGRAR